MFREKLYFKLVYLLNTIQMEKGIQNIHFHFITNYI